MTTVIYDNQTIRYDILGYDLINDRALQDLRTLLIIAIALAIGFCTIVKNEWDDAMELIGEWIDIVEVEIREFDEELFQDAIADVVEPLAYPLHNVKFYWQQLWISEEVLDLDYFEGVE